jgi:acyl-CoA thioesterase-1
VPLFLHNIDINMNLMQPDGIHPTEQAQPYMLDNIWPALQGVLK